MVPVNNDLYLLTALTRTDLKTLKASAGVPELWRALSGLWQAARVHSNGQPVCLPLIGSGLAGVGLPPGRLLELVLISLAQETKREHVANHFKIVLAPRLLDDIDLRQVRERWS